MLFRALLVTALLVVAFQLAAQSVTHPPQYVYWTRYQAQLQFSPRLFWNNEIDNRRFFNPDVQTQFIFHSRLHYRIRQWEIAGGLTGSFAYAAFPRDGYQKPVHEFRPVAEVSRETLFKRFSLQYRLRIDHRFLGEDAETSVFDEYNYVMRLRYRLQTRIPLLYDDADEMKWIIRLADEIMFNTEGNAYDQNRVYVTSEYRLSSSLWLETGYIYIHQHRFMRDEYFNRHVLRLSLLHRIRL